MVRQRTQHEKHFATGNPVPTQNVHQSGYLGQMLACCGSVASLLSKQGTQIGRTRILHAGLAEVVDIRTRLVEPPEIEQQTGPRHTGIHVSGIQLDGMRVVRERSRQIAPGMRDPCQCIPGGRVAGLQLGRPARPSFGFVQATRTDQERHLFHQRQQRIRPDCAGGLETVTGLGAPVQHRERDTTQRQQIRFHGCREPIRAELIDDHLGIATGNLDTGHRNDDFRAIHTEPERIAEGDLGRTQVAVIKIEACQQQLRGEHAAVLLQRVLQLNRGTSGIALVESREPIFVVACRRCTIGEHCMRRCHQRKQNQFESQDSHRETAKKGPEWREV